jgi:outer membrane receptor for ferric coprogen and ferric-rhodotorulic acid
MTARPPAAPTSQRPTKKMAGRENSLSETDGLARLGVLAPDLARPRRHSPWALLRAAALLVCLSLPSVAPAAESLVAFDVPAGEAVDTLKLAARQGSLEIVFFVDTVRGIRTPALRGHFRPRDALDRLVAGTGLVVVSDSHSSTLTVRRSEPVRLGSPPTPATTAPKPMNPSFTSRLAAAFTALAAASAQTVPAPSTGSPFPDETVVLSPFTVSTERDVGFVAASSLAGGRMATDLKDTPLAYSVLTREFLDTLAITDTETAMDWAVNSYQARGDAADRISNVDGGTRTRVRGVITKSLRNFFELGRFGDVYCQERVDFARGTNALLIGNAGLGGASIMLTKQATFDKRKGELGVSVSDRGQKRVTLDFNQPIGAKVAMRASLLKEDSNTWRDRVFDRRKGIYLTASARPWKQTQLRVDYEDFEQNELVAVNGLNDRVSGWDGVTVVDAPTGTVTNSNALGIERLGAATTPYILMLPGHNGTTLWNFANNWRTLGGGATTSTPVDGVLPTVFSNMGAAGNRISGVLNEPVSRFDIATAKSKFFIPTPDYVFAPNTPTFTQILRNTSVFVDQQIGGDFFVQAAYSRTKTGRLTNFLATRLTDVYVDVNRKLPDGSPNPYFLEPFVETTRDDLSRGIDNFKEMRLALAYVKNDTRFGSFRLNAIGGATNRHTDVRTYTHVMARNADIRQRPVNDSMGFRYYLNYDHRPYVFPGQMTYVDPIAGTSQTYPVQELLNIAYTDTNNRTAERQFDYVQASAFAKLFKDRLILLAGKRWDRFVLKTWNALSANTRASYPVDWDGKTLLFNPDAPANYWSLPATQRAIYNPPDLDQRKSTATYGGIINATKWLGGFYNYAQTYDTSRSVLTINGTVAEPLVSDGWDAGLRFTLAGGRINASISRYATTQIHTWSGVDRFEIPRLAEANALGDTSTNGRNIRGLGPVPSPYWDYQDAWAKGYEFEVVANLTKNWRLTCNYALPENYANNRYPETQAYLDKNLGTLKQIVLDTGAVIDATTQLASNPGVPTSQSPDINQAIADWNWIQAAIPTFWANVPLVSTAYKYTANLYTDYRFSSGRLKNLRVGGGVQFRSKIQLANRGQETIVNPANPTQAIDDPSVDANSPVYMDAWHMVTATLGYEMKLRENMRLSLNLNVSNLLNRTDTIYNGAALRPRNGDITNPSRVMGLAGYYPDPRTFRLTARLAF